MQSDSEALTDPRFRYGLPQTLRHAVRRVLLRATSATSAQAAVACAGVAAQGEASPLPSEVDGTVTEWIMRREGASTIRRFDSS